MINEVFAFYDNTLLYNPNGAFLFFFILIAFFLFLLFRCLRFLARSLPSTVAIVKQIHIVRFHKKISLRQYVLFVRQFSHVIDGIERKVLKRTNRILDAVAREVLISKNEREN